MESDFSIELVQLEDYRFEVHFDNAAVPALITVSVRVVDKAGTVLKAA
jgi:hypothetical protein